MTGFEPRDPDYAARMQESFRRQGVMQRLGIHVEWIAAGAVDLGFAMDDALTQQHGYAHAGVLTTALDSACGYAAMSLMAPASEVLTVEFKVNFLAPARGDRFSCRGRVIKPGRTLSVCEGAAYALTDSEEKLVATMMATMMTVPAQEG